MPELPEVESYGRTFARHALRKRIVGVTVRDERVLVPRREALTRALRGRRFTRVRRHGKHLFVHAGEVWLRLHFGMSGDLTFYSDPVPPPRFARVVFDFPRGEHLAFEDMRLFGAVDLTPDPDAYVAEHRLGPDPLGPDFRLPFFRRLVAARKGAIKAVLMSQDVIAGIGNLYADEALFQSAIHPRRSASALSAPEAAKLHAAIRRILREAIRLQMAGRDYPRRWLFDHRLEGERCPLCGGTIRRTVVFGRTTYFCGKHQRGDVGSDES